LVDYCAAMRLPGTWGDELTLRAAADLLRAKVYVITSDADNWLLQYDPSAVAGSGVGGAGPVAARCLFVTYVSPIHYNTIEHDTSAFATATPVAAPALPEQKGAAQPTVPAPHANPPPAEGTRRVALL